MSKGSEEILSHSNDADARYDYEVSVQRSKLESNLKETFAAMILFQAAVFCA